MLVFVLVSSIVLVGGLAVALAVAVSLRRELGRADEAIRSLAAARRRDPHR